MMYGQKFNPGLFTAPFILWPCDEDVNIGFKKKYNL